MTDFVESLQVKGRYTFTQAEAMKADRRSAVALEAAFRGGTALHKLFQ